MTIDYESLKANAEAFNGKVAKIVQNKADKNFSLGFVPYEDDKAMQLFQNADTEHIFCFASAELKNALKSCKPKIFDDLVSLYAIYKPSNVPEFPKIVSRAKENNFFDVFKDILEKTDGVPLWREQVFAIMQKATGCTLASADLLRRNMGKRYADVLAQNKKKFVEAAIKNNYSEQSTAELFENLIPFAAYTMNVSLDVSFVRIAWQSAFLKAHYPKEFDKAAINF